MTNMDPDTFRDYVANHVRTYLETDGEDGAIFNGLPCVVLTTVGARSGETRYSPVIRVSVPESDDYVVVASMGGAPKHPSWYFNLLAHPDQVTLQDRATKRRYDVRVTEGSEREELWELAASIYPEYEVYQADTERRIPVVRLTPAD